MQDKKFWIIGLLGICMVLVADAVLMADPIDDVLRIWQETIWSWGKRIFWFFGVSAAIVIAASPNNRKKALYVLGGVVLFYIAPLVIEFIQQAVGQPF